jgi:hypothetical protein
LVWLGRNSKSRIEQLAGTEFDRFCSMETKEWRIINEFGLAGKLWNTYEGLYVTGWTEGEIGEEYYEEQKKEIERMNQELKLILS